MPKSLLPLVDGTNPWPPFIGVGLNEITSNLFDGRLYRFDNIKSSGVPSPFAHPFIFSKKLERDDKAAFKQFSILVKGIFLCVIDVEVIPMTELGKLGNVLKGFQPGIKSFVILKWKGEPIGGIYPESLVFPGVRVTQEVLNKIEIENQKKEDNLGSVNVRGHFKQWVDEITNPLHKDNHPIWAQKLIDMTNQGNIWDASAVNLDSLPVLTDKSLDLAEVGVLDGMVTLVRYVDHLIKCQNKANEMVNLSDKSGIELRLGKNRQIICTKPDGNLVCDANCGSIGIGPTIDEAGFFERSPGNYLIWKDFDETSLPKGCTDIKCFDNHALLTFGKLKIRLEGEVASKDDILCKSVIQFDNGKRPDLPIKSKYLDCVDKVTVKDGGAYFITLRGIQSEIQHAPKVVNGDKASILLWPSFKDTNWKVNYAFFRPSITLNGMEPSIRLINLNNGNIEILSDKIEKADFGKRLNLPITHVEILLKEEPVGILRDNRKDAPTAIVGAIELSLDFGTSNTIFAIKKQLGGGAISYEGLNLTDKSFDMLGYHVEQKNIYNEANWMPSYAPDGTAFLDSIPSELIFVNHRDKFPQNLDQPIEKYSSPHKSYKRDGSHKLIIPNFKWLPAPDPFSKHGTEIINAYLTMVMHMALAALRDAPYARNSISFTATYPLAFGLDRYEEYKTLLANLINKLSNETGLVITQRSVTANGEAELIPESHAGKAHFTTKGYQLVVDIGGGTTDIALSKGSKILAIDSVKYGGNTYIESITNTNMFPKRLVPDGQSHKNLSKNEKKIILHREIRTYGFKDGVLKKCDDTAQETKVILTLKPFFEKLFEYLYLLLKAHNINDNITLYPIGNAWRFIDTIPDTDIDRYICDHFQEKGINLVPIADGTTFSRKGAVAEGALILADGGSFVQPNLAYPIKSVVGCNVQLSWNGDKVREIGSDERIPLKLNLPESDKPIVSTEEFINSLPSNEWQPKKKQNRHAIIERFNSKAGDALYYDGKTWCLRKSLFAEFLEKIVPKFYL